MFSASPASPIAVCSLVLLAAIGLVGCDRVGPGAEDDSEGGFSPNPRGSFEALVQSRDGAAFEQLEGPATFAYTEDSAAVVLEFRSPHFNRPDTTYFALMLPIDGAPTADVYPVGDFLAPMPGEASSCYQSFLFPDGDGAYRSDSGTVTITEALPGRLIGTLDMTMYIRIQTGSTTFRRVFLEADGTFDALPSSDLVPNDRVQRCAAV